LTLIPMPRTTWRICSRSVAISVRMPASLRVCRPGVDPDVVRPLQRGRTPLPARAFPSTSRSPPGNQGSGGRLGRWQHGRSSSDR
jgi:hypothetical protein